MIGRPKSQRLTDKVPRGLTAWAAALALALTGGAANAAFSTTTIDLTGAGASGSGTSASGNGALFVVQQIDAQSTGTGVIDSFLRVQAQGNNNFEQGYNTSSGTPLDDKGGGFTHAITLGDVPIVNINGTDYRQFLLDINQVDSGDSKYLSLNQVQIFTRAGDPQQSDVTFSSTASDANSTKAVVSVSGGTEVFRLSNGGANDSQTGVLLNFDLNPGSGGGDMFLYVENSKFTQNNALNVILFSHFGKDDAVKGAANDGIEEWATFQSNAVATPAPAGLILVAIGMATFGGGAGFRRLRRAA